MQSARPPERPWGARTTWTGATDAGPTHHRLAGADRPTINRLTRDGRGTARGHPGPGRLLLHLAGRGTGLLLLQARHHIGAWRHHGTRGRLSGKVRARLRAQGRSRRRRRQWRGRFAGRRRRASHRLSWQCDGRRRHGRRRSSRRHRLSRPRQNLPRTRRRHWPRGNRTASQRRMQRRGAATAQQRRPQGRRLASKRFFDRCCSGIMGLGHRCRRRLQFGSRNSSGLRGILVRTRLRSRDSISRRNSVGCRKSVGCWNSVGRWDSSRRLRAHWWFISAGGFERLRLRDGHGSISVPRSRDSSASTLHSLANDLRHRLIDGTGVSLFLGNAEPRQHVDDFVGGNLQLPCQLVDANFTHK
jgi:hypothetical protein